MKVSVCITAYNHERFIAQAIESVLMQQVNFDYEIIIGEDDSSDNTRDICRMYQGKYPDKIRLFLNERKNVVYVNGRPTGRWNFVNNLLNSRGEYVALLDGDDYWVSPKKLQMQANILDDHPEFSICFHNTHVLWEDGRRESFMEHIGVRPREIFTLDDLIERNFLSTGSVVFRNGLIERLPDDFYHVLPGDWFLHILNAQHGPLRYVDEVMGCYRKNAGGLWTSLTAEETVREKIHFYRKVLLHLDHRYAEKIRDRISALDKLISEGAAMSNSTERCNGQDMKAMREQDDFLNPALTRANMDRYTVRSAILRAVREFVPHCKGTLLDIGCGEMPYKSLMMSGNSKITKYIGMDIQNPKYQQNMKPDIYWDGRQIPLDDNSADCAMATELFEHLPDLDTVLKEVRRVLKPGGSLFFTVPFLWPLHDMPQDEYRYTPFSMKRHLESAGFGTIRMNALGGWDSSLAQMIGLWVIRRPMSDERRNEFVELLFPFYKELIESEMKNAPVLYDDMVQQSLMITGLTGIAVKPFASVMRGSVHENSETAGVHCGRRSGSVACTQGGNACAVGKKDGAMNVPGIQSISKPVLAIVCPQVGAASETFIRKHIEMLLPERTVVLTSGIVDGSWLKAPVKIVPHAYGGEKYPPAAEADIVQFLKEHSVTHILCEFGSVGTGIIALNERLLHLPLYVHFHGQDASEELRKPAMVKYYHWMGRRVAGVIAVSRPMAERLTGIGIPEDKIKVISCGVSIPEDNFAAPEHAPCRFISVSRLVPKKGVPYLIDAFAKAQKVSPGITLDIIGDGPLRKKIEELIRQNGISDSVHLHGQREHSYVLNMLCKSSVYAQHSLTDPATGNAEGLPVGILEASAHGLPVISTFHEGIPEAIDHTVSGFLVNEGDTDAMAEYMIRLANDGSLRKKMGLAGRRKISKGFTDDISLGKLREFIGISSENPESRANAVNEIKTDAERPGAGIQPVRDLSVRKVLFVNHNLAPYELSGTPITTLNHAVGMKARGMDVAVLIPGTGIREHFTVEQISDIPVYKVPRLDKYGSFLNTIDQKIMEPYLRSIEEIVKDFQPDIVHINDYVYMPAQIVECFRRAGCIVIRSVCNEEEICHQDYPVIKAGLDSSLCFGPETAEKCAECFLKSRSKKADRGMRQNVGEKITERRSSVQHMYDADVDGVIFTEERFREHFTRFVQVPDEKIRVIPRGFHFSFPRVHTAKTVKSGAVRFAFIGNLMFSKGIDVVLKAFESLSDSEGFTLDIYGHATDKAYLPWIKGLQERFPGRISMKGSFKKDDLLRIAAEIDICIIPSYFDTYNRVVREMLYCGVPLITTDFFGASIVRDGFNGLKMPVGDHAALARAMKRIIEDPSLIQTLSEGVLKTGVPTLSSETEAIHEFYDYLYQNKKQGLLRSNGTESGVRAIAFYLPQFHPTPENDMNWGKGFTEWRNVAKAEPYFEGHYQPHLPADLGFYDLRLPEVREEQAAMAAKYGIGGFCYYHYWFHGRRLLNRPFDEVLASGKPDFPFCLCWANENWTRAWDGHQGDILIEQTYSAEDDRDHIRWLLKVFEDKRYIRINGRPLILIYLSRRLPDPARTVRIWREEAKKKGEELYLCKAESLPVECYDPALFGFDAAVEFQPDWGNLGPYRKKLTNGHIVFEYPEIVERMIKKPKPPYKRFPCVTPRWDNSPRRKHGALIMDNSTPDSYAKWLNTVVSNLSESSADERIVFINAWNEWGEGNHLEPDEKFGAAYLEATRQSLSGTRGRQHATEKGLTSIIILTFNQLEYTRKCVESIKKYTPEAHEIVFVDNGSTDGTVKWLNQLLGDNDNYRMIENGRNLGFAKGCNQGIQVSNGEYILLLNNDVEVTEGWLSGMIECLESSPETGIIGPMTNNISGIQKDIFADYQSVDRLPVYAKGFRERNRHRRIAVRRVVGFCMLFRRELVEKIGMLDERFGSGNFEDDDFCLRAVMAGYWNHIAGDVFIHHYGNRSFVGNRIDYYDAMANNRKLFDKKWNAVDPASAPGKQLVALKSAERAGALSQRGMIQEAVEAYLHGIKHAPEDAGMYFALAEMLIDEKRFADAGDVLREMPRAEESMKRTALLGYCHDGMDMQDEAEKCADAVLSRDGRNALALNLKGILAYKKGQTDEAERLFTEAVECDPAFGEPYTNLGVLKWSAGSADEALYFSEKGFVLAPTLQDMLTIYHSIASAQGELERMEWRLREAKSLHPLHRRITFFLIDVLIRQGKNEEALSEIQEAMITFGTDDGIISAALEIRKRIEEQGKEERGSAGKQEKGKLSLCMIVKNEEKYIARCLKNAAPVVDEMIIVDTGSTDRTKDIAKVFGAQVHDFEWKGDFSEARNFSLNFAAGDWILILDADEVISPDDYAAIGKIVHSNGKKPAAYSFVTRNYVKEMTVTGWTENKGRYREEAGSGWFPGEKVRLFPNDKRIQFANPVHELVEPSLKKAGIRIKDCGVPIHHYGKLGPGKVISKGEDYYVIGKKKLEEKHGDIQALFELAVQATELKNYDRAVELWKDMLGFPGKVSDEILARAYLNLGGAYLELGKYEDAISSSKKAVELAPDFRGAAINYALAELCAGDISNAVGMLEALLIRNDYPPAKTMLAAAYCISGKNEKGREYLNEMKVPGFNAPEYLHHYARHLVSAGKMQEGLALLDAAVGSGNVNRDIVALLAECYRHTGIGQTVQEPA